LKLIDWLVVVGLNGGVIVLGLILSRGVRSSSDWFLARRSLPWWMVGLSLYATAIDSSDLIADSGGTYHIGIRYFVTNWVGVTAGWLIAARLVWIPMHRAGMYTNAEYLEARYGPGSRVLSVFVQVQYRTLVMGIIHTTLYLLLSVVCGWSPAASWCAVGALALVVTVYTALGGLRSVVATDACQFALMAAAALVFWCLLWGQAGGWRGLETRLESHLPGLAADLLHAGEDLVTARDVQGRAPGEIEKLLLLGGAYDEARGVIEQRTSAWLVALGLIIMGVAYSVVNHTQAMRALGARSEWDLRMAAVLAGGVLACFTFFNLSMGILGRALHPDPSLLPGASSDSIYPLLIRDLGVPVLTGLIVSGVLASAMSTYDSMGSALSALLTRDVYARLLVKGREDRHYLRVSQWLTPVVIGGSFLYVPFLVEGGMLFFYLDLTSVFVVPLLTLYLMGALTRVHRRSGVIGLAAGAAYGVMRLAAPWAAQRFGVTMLPPFLLDSYGAYAYAMLITAAAMLAASLLFGWEAPGKLLHEERGKWLEASRRQVQELQRLHPERRGGFLPAILGLLVLAAGLFLAFVLFW
jgi:SSS family solute:Na+ symporter